MRSKLSLFSLTGLIAAFFALPTSAHTGPNIEFGYGPRLPQGCTAVEADIGSAGTAYNLQCEGIAEETVMDFSIIIQLDSQGMAGYSFGAQWDDGLNEYLTVNSATQGTQTSIEVAPGPPPVTVGFNVLGGSGHPVGPGGIEQSTKNAPGQATNWEAIGASPDPAVNVLTANASFRAGRINVTLGDDLDPGGTAISLGWYNPLQDAFVVGDASTLSESDIFFAKAMINYAPEPASSLALLAGIASVALLARRERRNR